MGANRFVSFFVNTAKRVSDLLGDREEPVDGLLWEPGPRWMVFPHTGTSWTNTRSAAGDYRLARTSAGAETHRLALPLSALCRRAAVAGLKVLNLVVAYSVTVANATSVDAALNRAVYADRVAPAVAAYGGTGVYDATHDTAAERASATAGNNPHLLTLTLPDPQYQDNDTAALTCELTVVIPNTCVFTLYGGGFRAAHNYL